ncbi:D-2-hydroxyacid dehydrogenase [Engelhardtia mirabilis]|uniref:Glyoxylate/hydroxypyruvate reductase B n=1 Tax=Engelhardtia mirabilis TaxID=2528011 RepID=A0A518BEQ3_9BACT|nr:Glyoxylate/hydroxypyruvate reductase B [Planctomycetes bacterium Pla133]QDU99786.1 Glyoxylate/hydroxypyruvate reductase B [Planctomycetes bacterium Pla86]
MQIQARHAGRALAVLALLLGSCASPGDPIEALTIAPGAERGSTVAVDPAFVNGPLVYLTSAIDDDEIAELTAGREDRIEIIGEQTRESVLRYAGRAHGIDAHLLSEEFLAAAPNLAWVQSYSAGVERYIELDGLTSRPEVVLTNAKGVHGPVIAEHVFAMLLAQLRGLYAYAEAQVRENWDRDAAPETASLAGRTMLVAGMGGIGSQVAQRAHAFDMRVLATVRTERPAPDYVDVLATGDRLDELLAQTDVLVICLPLTDETRGMFDARRLNLLRPGAFVVNIARGPILDTDALLAALDSGHLAGACLDVTDPEPLPPGHELWWHEGVTITPHVAGRAELTVERRDVLVRENMERFIAGEPLLNVVDRELGY